MMLTEKFAQEYAAERLGDAATFSGRMHRVIEGVATTSNRNKKGVVIDPAGARCTLPIPLLLDHNGLRPVGRVIALKRTYASGIARLEFVARVATHGVPAIEEIWEALKSGAIGQASALADNCTGIGEIVSNYSLLEISVCESAANPDCLIEVVKELDRPDCVHLAGPTPEIVYRYIRRASWTQ